MAKTTSAAPKGSKKGGKKGKMPLGQRVVIGAAVLGLAWYLYTKQKAKKQAEEQKKLMGGGGPLDGYNGGVGTGGTGGAGAYGGVPMDPNTGLPCSEVFGGCPDGGVYPPGSGGPGTGPGIIYGCMSPNANNFNAAASVDDGTCDYTPVPSGDIYGCMDSLSNNYNADATINELSASDSSEPCTYDPTPPEDIYGCTDVSANNYLASATINEVSDTDSGNPCTYDGNGIINGCVDPLATNYNSSATDDDGSCTYDGNGIINGCVDPLANNYNSSATDDDGSCDYTSLPSCDIAIPCYSTCEDGAQEQTFTTASCGIIDDCGDSTGFPLSSAPMCAQPQEGCIDPAAVNYDPNANEDNGTCYYNPGCNDPSACNYDASADYDDGSCQPVFYGCGDANADNYNPSSGTTSCNQVDNDSCIYSGCTDVNATNYDASANADDGSCDYTPEPIIGCGDPSANNFNPNVTQSDNSCTYDQISCDYCDGGYPTSQFYNGPNCPQGTILTGSGNPCAGQDYFGCTDVNANNYNQLATTDDGSCTYNNGVTCYSCVNGSVQGQSYSGLNSCPQQGQSTDPNAFPNCGQSNNITCYWCDNGQVSGASYMNTSTCPQGSTTGPNGNTTMGSFCNGGNGKTISCDDCVNGVPQSQYYNGTSCPGGTIPSGSGNPCQTRTLSSGNGNAVSTSPGLGNAGLYTGSDNVVLTNNTNSTNNSGGGNTFLPYDVKPPRANFSGFDGNDQGFGNWQRRMARKVMIDDTDWNPIVS